MSMVSTAAVRDTLRVSAVVFGIIERWMPLAPSRFSNLQESTGIQAPNTIER
jgi:hypothetical protein